MVGGRLTLGPSGFAFFDVAAGGDEARVTFRA
jgi:hypothetical protein